jgi:hypothetical protein
MATFLFPAFLNADLVSETTSLAHLLISLLD